jgi:hypothetical protein
MQQLSAVTSERCGADSWLAPHFFYVPWGVEPRPSFCIRPDSDEDDVLLGHRSLLRLTARCAPSLAREYRNSDNCPDSGTGPAGGSRAAEVADFFLDRCDKFTYWQRGVSLCVASNAGRTQPTFLQGRG